MAERKYSLSEIDQMRDAIRNLMTDWRYGDGRVVGGFLPKDSDVEDRLRTYMLNGTEPNELTIEAQKIFGGTHSP